MTEVVRRPSTRRPNMGGVVDAVRSGLASPTRPGCSPATASSPSAAASCATPSTSSSTPPTSSSSSRSCAATTVDGLSRSRRTPTKTSASGSRTRRSTACGTCNNKCFFCFLKGNPKGMRKTLYVKDDDYRLSFFHGNFVTLTNLDEDDWAAARGAAPVAAQRLGARDGPRAAALPARQQDGARHRRAAAAARRDRHRGEHAGRAVPRRQRRRGARPHDRRPRCALPDGADDLRRAGRRDDDGRGAHRTRRARRRDRRHAQPSYARSVIAQVAPYQRRLPARARRARSCTWPTSSTSRPASTSPPPAHYDGFAQYENGIGMTRSLLEDWARQARQAFQRKVRLHGLAAIWSARGTAAPAVRPIRR